ncbi:MAG TPA: TetR/AcrR family transcriptional regulator [Capillimicrobium sp.]|nr:TetR/AcrR family transcriptional regulator [Capillimicrobium sp.]
MSSAADHAPVEEQRTRLLEGLAASIREKGLAQTQLTDIVRHARASRRTFYKHFPDKDSCFVELLHRVAAEIQARLVEAIDREADWQTQVDQAVDRYLAELEAEPELTLTFASPSLGERIVRAQREAIEQYAVLVKELADGEAFRRAGVREISLEQAYMLVSGLHLTVVRAVDRGEDLAPLAPEFKAVFKAVLA